jgi:glycosyltransferase involved in cell wall biosynthesis
MADRPSQRVLVVSPYPPERDGIGSYAVQEVASLLRAGDDVEVLSPGPSAAHHHLQLRGWRGPLALAKRVAAYDRVVIQFHPDVFFPVPSADSERLAVSAGLVAMCLRGRNVELRVHEVDYDWCRAPGAAGWMFRRLWRSAAKVVVHTEEERVGLAAAAGLPVERIDLMAHGAHFARHTEMDRAQARRHLGIDPEAFTFLAIGFIQPHKGFDRAIRAFDGLGAHGCRLDVVGSLRLEEPDFVRYLDDLRAAAAATPGVEVHDGYLSDERFDQWIVACDALVLPYRFIWSSGVLERAALFDRPVIAARVGGLAAQAPAGTVLVDDDDELRDAMWAAGVGAVDDQPEERSPWPVRPDGTADPAEIARAIAQRAHRRGGASDRPVAVGVHDRPPLSERALLQPPRASGGLAARVVKKLVRRLTAWEIDPLVHRINELHVVAVGDDEPEPPGGA